MGPEAELVCVRETVTDTVEHGVRLSVLLPQSLEEGLEENEGVTFELPLGVREIEREELVVLVCEGVGDVFEEAELVEI